MGIKKLSPILFEILRFRVEEIVAEAYYTIARVSGNAIIAECGDHEEALLDADGNMVMVAGGIVEWTYALEAACKHLVRAYEENPGINEGDQFILNHAYIACVHGMDVQTLAPVFWQGKRVAWVVAAGHTIDIGGMDPGGFQMRAEEFYQEGLQIPGLKIVEGGRIRKDVEETLKSMVRQPDLFMLDVSAKIAANNASSARLISMIKQYGIDVVLALFKQLQQYSEDLVKAKLKTIPDGTWRTCHYMESLRKEERYLKVEVALTKEADSLTIDFTGSSPQSRGSQNLAEVGTISNALCSYLTCFAYNIPWSAGVWKPTKFIIPKGTAVNPIFPAATSFNTPAGMGYLVIGAVQDVISKMLLCSESWKGDVYANTGAGGHSPTWVGYDANHVHFETVDMHALLGGMGALVDRDGEDASSNMWSPKTKCANIEFDELLFPVMYLASYEAIDTGGAGKFRGGVANAIMATPWKAEEFILHNKDWGMEPRIGNGLSGGYPPPQLPQWIIRNSNIVERLKRGEFPRNFSEIGGDWEILPSHLIMPLNAGEVLFQYQCGGGGFGDPIERDPQLVLRDVKLGYVSLKAAKDIYGVVIVPGELVVKQKETQECRQKIIDERLRVGKGGEL